LQGIQTLVDRTSRSGRVIAADERVDVRAAVEAFTVNGAWSIRREDRLGRVAPRFLADLTLLAENPLSVDPSTIATIEVLGTVVDGRTWFA